MGIARKEPMVWSGTGRANRQHRGQEQCSEGTANPAGVQRCSLAGDGEERKAASLRKFLTCLI